MQPYIFKCKQCGYSKEIKTFRKFVVCPSCDGKSDFHGFIYNKINKQHSKYAGVEYSMDCPSCRSENMMLFTNKWHCEDCGYTIKDKEKNKSVFWFCDNCEAFLNVQDNFSTKSGKWRCTECGYVSGVSEDDIL